MALFKVFRGKAENLPEPTHDGYAYLTTDTGKFYIDSGDRRILINPDITAQMIPFDSNNTVAGMLEFLLHKKSTGFEINTTEYWQTHADLISEKDVFYVFSDGYVTLSGQCIPRMKLGDGVTKVIDLSFMDSTYYDHITNMDIHVTPAQKAFWNTKLICSEERVEGEQVIYQYDTFNSF